MNIKELRTALKNIDHAIQEGAKIPAWEITEQDVAIANTLRKMRIQYQTAIVNIQNAK